MQQKFSLHLGLNNIDKARYQIRYGQLNSPENDAKFYYSIAQRAGFIAQLFLGEAVIASKVVNEITSVAKKMRVGDLFFLTFSGHGGRIKDMDNDEESGFDQILILYDMYLIDDELKKIWLLFPENSGIFFVTDSCLNGTVSRFYKRSWILKNEKSTENIYRGGISFTKTIFSDSSNIHLNKKQPVCCILHMAACGDNETARDGKTPNDTSNFTTTFKSLYNEGGFVGSYKDFFDQLCSVVKNQTPNWDTKAGSNKIAFENKVFLEF